jgi:aspartyl-tRNA(Asn)/glutamyl-tRNA(Gln) amidotransferase subunit C
LDFTGGTPVPLSSEQINHIAHLARLRIDADDADRYAGQLSRILELVAQMDAVDTERVEPMSHPLESALRLREDLITEFDRREAYQAVAPATENGLYLVPKVIE